MTAPRRAVPSRRAAEVARRGSRPEFAVLGLFLVAIMMAGVGGWSLLQALAPNPVTAGPVRGWELTELPAATETSVVAPNKEPSDSPGGAGHGSSTSAPSDQPPTPATSRPPHSSPPPETSADSAVAPVSRLVIDQLQVTAPIDVVGSRNGELLVPQQLDHVGLWTGGAQLGDSEGTVLVAGHLAIGEQRGVGYRWSELTPGAEVITIDDDGARQRWRAISLDVYDGYELPAELFNRTGPRRLALVTCSGPVVTVDGRREYRDNVVIIAEPIA